MKLLKYHQLTIIIPQPHQVLVHQQRIQHLDQAVLIIAIEIAVEKKIQIVGTILIINTTILLII